MSPGSPKVGAMLTTSSIRVAHRGQVKVRSRRWVLAKSDMSGPRWDCFRLHSTQEAQHERT